MHNTEKRGAVVCLVCLLAAILALTARPGWSQQVTAAITGAVTDPSGAPIANASVSAKDLDRGTVWPTTSNADGVYNLPRVPTGRYEVRAEAKGFQTAVRPSIQLELNQAARVDFQMQLGQVSEVVEVTSAPPLLQTETTQMNTVINARTNEALPLATRNYVQLTLLAPGSVNPNPQSMTTPQTTAGAGRPYINGNREQANNFLLGRVPRPGLDSRRRSLRRLIPVICHNTVEGIPVIGHEHLQ